ncbi:cell envelope biogenesis protein OmpA [Flavobacterium noncentrifugens]|uniref:WD40-like Beta Propeller Repeat n=1 Tax=Flavobacterium noncentrifugens TaxID=1128970 RepID=A0A1G8YRC1_9FLAO|nr:OmpA family protein [Flavobacterium noncentrifugens]GEP51333.1 cell envelope biogenesis protein OmpA [Flavobacterium noncentrifugens]SDK05392.1 WD40-like Beta Propeller Repeat [Flavobacterium noncentrifugens]
MKHCFYLLFIFCFGVASGQKASEKKANSLFEKREYVAAAKMYEEVKENQNVLQNLGDSYYNNSQMIDATRVYGKLFLTYKDSLKPEVYFRYAHALLGIADYAKADDYMGQYLKYNVNTVKFIANLNTNVPYNYVIQPMAKNTSNGDFGISFYGDKVAFASLRNGESKAYGWNDRPYLDLFSGEVDSKGQLVKVEPFPKEINTKTHESNATFSSDGKIMYFNRTGDKKVAVGEDKFASVKIFKAEFKDGKWENVSVVPFSSDTYSTEHPVLSKDGKKLYFSSDMPGSIGSFDIYVVDVNEDGTFGTPQNMGNTINTIHREQFPFISDDGTILYFASDGHQGMGGLDIFMSKSYSGVFAKPLNLGETINSNMDDFGYVVDEKKNTGYLASNRKGGDNLYSFTRKENEDRYIVEGDVKDKNTQALLPGTQVTLYDENDKLVGQMIVGATADYTFNTEPNKKYRIEAARDFYIPHSEEFTTNEDGKMRYTIELFMECYDDAEEIITRRQDGKVQIVLENIYFDLNKWDIKPEAASVLNVLLDLLKKYPEMEVELGAHTDSRASNMYNMILSNKRAAATLDYLVKNGIQRKRLQSKGYGEEMPLIKCGDAKPCTEQEHSINRRCEFIILK